MTPYTAQHPRSHYHNKDNEHGHTPKVFSCPFIIPLSSPSQTPAPRSTLITFYHCRFDWLHFPVLSGVTKNKLFLCA